MKTVFAVATLLEKDSFDREQIPQILENQFGKANFLNTRQTQLFQMLETHSSNHSAIAPSRLHRSYVTNHVGLEDHGHNQYRIGWELHRVVVTIVLVCSRIASVAAMVLIRSK